jgi:hypothetical protein
VTEELDVLRLVTSRLESARIPYMMTGSMAVNYYAVPRMTRDIDLVVDVSVDDADRLCALFEADFYIDRDAVRAAIADRTTFNAIHGALVLKVDFVVRRDSEYRCEEFRRRRSVAIGDTAIFVVAPEDLIISKLDWARDTRSEVQLADVRNLLAAVPDLDREYLGAVDGPPRARCPRPGGLRMNDTSPETTRVPGDAAGATRRRALEDGLLAVRHRARACSRLSCQAASGRLPC